MKAAVVYDTYYGNTKLVAEAIAEQLKADGLEVEVKSVRDDPQSPQADMLFVGSPIRMGGPTGRVKHFVKKLEHGAWKDKPVVVFVTISPKPKEPTEEKQLRNFDKWALGGGRKLRDLAKKEGLNVVDDFLWIEVVQNDAKAAVLAEGGIEKTKRYTHDFLATVKK